MMQAFSFNTGYSSASDSATEMHTLDTRRQRKSHRQPNTAQNDDILEMDNANIESPTVASTEFSYLGPLSPLQRRHKARSFEKLEVEGYDEVGYLSDSCLPSVRQSLARSRHFERDINEGTPLLSRQHSIADLERVEQALDDDNEDIIIGDMPRSRRRQTIKKYGKQIKIAILFAVMLASIVSCVVQFIKLYSNNFIFI